MERTNIDAFVLDMYRGWYGKGCEVQPQRFIMSPGVVGYKSIAEEINLEKFGAYTLNPAMQDVRFDCGRIFIPDLSRFVDQSLHKVIENVVTTYGTSHRLPGLEYQKWLREEQNRNPDELKDGRLYFLVGSLVCDHRGRWGVPCARWLGSEWRRGALWLTGGWGSGCRVVLLEIEH